MSTEQQLKTNSKYIDHDQISKTILQQVDCKEVEAEAFYENELGNGYADLYLKTDTTGYVVESKAQPETANKTIRQFKRMRNNFFRGSEFEIPHQTIHILAFSASKANLEHIESNKELYSSVRKEVGQVKSQIWLVDKEETCQWTKSQSWSEFREQVENDLNVTDFSKNYLECPYCGKQYRRESYFKKHVRGCNEDTKVQKVKQ